MRRICPYCQNSFIPKRIDAVYCCPSHKQMAYKERKMNLSVNFKSVDGLQLSENKAKPSTKYLNENEESSTKSFYPSTKEMQEDQKPSINVVDTTDYPSTKMIYPSTEGPQENQKPSTNTEKVTNYPSIDDLEENKNQQKDHEKDQEIEYKHYKSSFVDALIELTNERDNLSKLAPLFWNDSTRTYLWVSTRFKCLVECLLAFSEMKTIQVDDLKEICNAFTLMIHSRYFNTMSNSYPYTNEILGSRESLKKICQSAEDNETLKFRLLPQTKKELIATRWELHYYVPKVNFSELNFKE